jgi:hypothetical protein
LASCASEDAVRVAGKAKQDLPDALALFAELIHRDDMVVWKK